MKKIMLVAMMAMFAFSVNAQTPAKKDCCKKQNTECCAQKCCKDCTCKGAADCKDCKCCKADSKCAQKCCKKDAKKCGSKKGCCKKAPKAEKTTKK